MRWKPAWRRVMIGAAMALSAGIAAGGVGDLEYVKSSSYQGTSMSCRTRKPVGADGQAAAGLKSPKAILLRDSGAIRIALDAETPGGQLNVIRIDGSGTGTFRDATVVKPTVRNPGPTGYGRFGPVLIEVPRNGRTVPVTVIGHFHGTTRGGAGAAVAAEGSCRFGRTRRKVRIIDGNGNLGLADAARPPFGTSRALAGNVDIVVVADAGGKFPGGAVATALLGQPTLVDGAWYVLSVEGLKVSAAAIPAGARITVPANQWRCTLAGEKHFLTVSGGREPVALPPDRYRVRSYRLSLKSDGAARGPTIGGGGSTQSVDVPAGKTTPLGIGSPIRARVTVTKSPAGVRLSLSQTDAAGAEISSVLGTGGKRPAKPEIDVVDGKGKVVYTAKLEYG